MISYYDLLKMVKDDEAPRKIRVYLAGHPREYEAIDDLNEFSYYSLIGEPDDDYRYYLSESYIESCMFEENIEVLDKKIDKYKYQTSQIPSWFRDEELIRVINENFEKHTKAIYDIIDHIDTNCKD